MLFSAVSFSVASQGQPKAAVTAEMLGALLMVYGVITEAISWVLAVDFATA